MIKRRNWLLLILVCVLSIQGRIFFVGSNPYLSIFAFPQDVTALPSEFVFFYPSMQKLPWWGDVDEPTHRPNDSYTVTGENIKESSANFDHDGVIRSFKNHMGICYKPNPGLVHYVDVMYDVNAFSNKASGILTNSDNNNTIPFDYSITNSSHEVRASSIWGFHLKGLPVGIKLNLGLYQLGSPNQRFVFNKNDQPYETSRMVWGWATVGCNHIFGPRSTEGDAWFQNEYSRGPLYRMDLQVGTTMSRMKWGGRFRYIFGKQDQFRWQSQPSNISDTIIRNNFIGDYVKSDWATKTHDLTYRLYNNVTLKKGERYSLNTLLFLGYNAHKSKNALTENLDVEDDALEAARTFIVEVNPNINIYPWKTRFAYIDAALLLEYAYTRIGNTNIQRVNGGDIRAYRRSTVYVDDEYSWENFSYANENFVDVGVDLSMMFPLYGNANSNLGLGIIHFINTKFTWLNKYFGENNVVNNDLEFEVANMRKNYRKEIWINTMLNLHYKRGPAIYQFQFTAPLLYLLQPRTQVTDKEGKTILYEHEKKGNWASQQGVKAAIFFAYDLPALRNLFRRNSPGEF